MLVHEWRSSPSRAPAAGDLLLKAGWRQADRPFGSRHAHWHAGAARGLGEPRQGFE